MKSVTCKVDNFGGTKETKKINISNQSVAEKIAIRNTTSYMVLCNHQSRFQRRNNIYVLLVYRHGVHMCQSFNQSSK